MAGQFLNYTNLTFNEIVSQVNDRLREDPEKRFDNFLESSVAKTMIDIFAASTDLTNYYIERRAEEQFLDTARLKSSIIQLSKILGYVIQRPVPAQSSVKILLKGPLPSGLVAGDTVSFPRYETKFTYNGSPFVLKKTYKYTFTDADITQGINNNFQKEISVSVPNGTELVLNQAGLVPTSATSPIEILQGEIKQKTFKGTDNIQVGNIFQKYEIDDVTFSNMFGSEDLGYDIVNETSTLEEDLTKIAITPSTTTINDALGDENNLYEIDRRSILTSETVLAQTTDTSTLANVCSIRTKTNQGIEILFGDDKFASKGVESTNQNLYVQYFSTKGAEVNATGLLDKKLTTSNGFSVDGKSIDLTSNIEWRFNSNVIGGADLESVDSIKLNAPELFYSLDRLVTSRDYVSYLKSLTSPVNIKNAIAWGEQEEVDNNPNVTAIKQLFNVVFYTCLGSLYNIDSSNTPTHSFKDIISTSASDEDKNTTLIEGTEYDIGGTTFGEQNYFNVYIKNDVVSYLNDIETSTAPGVGIVNNKIKKRSQLTVRNGYITPLIQQFDLTGDVYVKNLVSINDIQRRVNNALYEFLDEKADFNSEIFLSNIIEVIESFPEVLSTTPKFTPVSGIGLPITDFITTSGADINIQNWTTSEQSLIITQFDTSLNNFLQPSSPTYDILYDIRTSLGFPTDSPTNINLFESERKLHARVAELNERNFYEKFMKHFYDNITVSSYKTSNDFKELFSRANQQMKHILRSSMLDENGNIVNFSFRHEIAQIISQLNFKYRG